jgi:hypothetical protein
MDAALVELQALDAEQDLSVKDVHGEDSILAEIDNLLLGRIGKPYYGDQLRLIVDEAVSFRYPNFMPPGYSDADKPTPLLAAGDYILWRQVMDKAAILGGPSRRILLITNDLKEDWWTLSAKGKPVKARAELQVELYQNADASLALLTLVDFLEEAKKHLFSRISEATVDQIRTVTSNLDLVASRLRNAPDRPDLLDLPPADLEALVSRLFGAMGYDPMGDEDGTGDGGIDLTLMRTDILLGKASIVVEVKRYRGPVGSDTVRAVIGAMQLTHANKGVIVTTSSFTPGARRLAENASIELIDGRRLLELLLQYLDLRARIGDMDIEDGPVDET